MKMNWIRYGVVTLCVTVGACASNPKPTDDNKAKPQESQVAPGADSQAGNVDDVNGQSLSTEAAGAPAQRLVYFDYDVSQLTSAANQTLDQHVTYLRAHPELKVRIEGHADERGSREYNLALGEQRSLAVQRYLSIAGIDTARLSVFSYGEEKPVAMGHDNGSWQQNRRAELVY
jgi:peptidoglycan-associated lipoprotein